VVDGAIRTLGERYGVGELLSGTLLLVDDDQPNVYVLAALLEVDYAIDGVTSGALGPVAPLKLLGQSLLLREAQTGNIVACATDSLQFDSGSGLHLLHPLITKRLRAVSRCDSSGQTLPPRLRKR